MLAKTSATDYATTWVTPSTGGGSAMVVNTYTASSTLVNADRFGYVRYNSATAVNCTVPNDTTLATTVVGDRIGVRQIGVGLVTFVPASGVALVAPIGCKLITAGKNATVFLTKVAANTWELDGDCAPATIVLDLQTTGTNGSTVFTDSSVNAVTVTNTGGVTIASNRASLTAGKYLSVPGHKSYNSFSTRDFILSTKFKTSQTQQYTALVMRDGAAGNLLLLINDTAGGGNLALYSNELGSPALVTTTGGYANNVEHTCVLRRVGATLTIEIDGTVRGTVSTSAGIADNLNPINFGNDIANGSRQFIGTMGLISLEFP